MLFYTNSTCCQVAIRLHNIVRSENENNLYYFVDNLYDQRPGMLFLQYVHFPFCILIALMS
jgi:hypothetical protein